MWLCLKRNPILYYFGTFSIRNSIVDLAENIGTLIYVFGFHKLSKF